MRSSINFKAIEKRVFYKNPKTGVISLGGIPLTKQIQDLLREQANYLASSQIFEILDATITNEAASLALIQSTDFDQVQFAKALHHWNFVLRKIVLTLSK